MEREKKVRRERGEEAVISDELSFRLIAIKRIAKRHPRRNLTVLESGES